MKQINIARNTRLVLALCFALVMVIVIAYLQILLKFNTYVALVLCMLVAIFALSFSSKGN